MARRNRLAASAALVGLLAALTLGVAGASGDTAVSGFFPIRWSNVHHGHGHPVAGRVFKGIAVINSSGVSGNPQPFSVIRCAAQIGDKRLPAHKTTSGSATSGNTQMVVCAWHIPAGAAGKRLRLWNNNGPSLTWAHRAYARVGNEASGSQEFIWRVLKP